MDCSTELLSKLVNISEECICPEELRTLFAEKQSIGEKPIAYNGFEPSGQMHIGSGILTSHNVNTLIECGCRVKIWIADWFAMLNNKMGGDLDKIRIIGDYMIEVWKACGMDMDRVEFLWASQEIAKDPARYWSGVMKIAMNQSVARLQRCATIMGRKGVPARTVCPSCDFEIETEDTGSMKASTIMYPMMQCNDVFFLDCDILQLGMDQRKVNVLAREMSHVFGRRKPVVLSHHMLMGLQEGQEKMSKSKPNSAIFMTDTEADVNRKIKKAYCKPGDVNGNPIIDYAKHLIFPILNQKSKSFIVNRPEKYGGDLAYWDCKELLSDFMNEKVHPGDLKKAVKRELNLLLEPVRIHFKENKEAKKLLQRVQIMTSTS